MMNKALFSILILLFVNTHSLIAQDFKWAINPKGDLPDVSNDMVADPNGFTYIGGYFYSGILNIGTEVLNCSGGMDTLGTPCEDALVCKFDSSYHLIWARKFGEMNYHERIEGIDCDSGGNTYVTGWFTSQNFHLDTFTLYHAGNWDAFIAKLDTAGNVLWAQSASGGSDDVGTGITVDPFGNVIATGYFYSSPFVVGDTALTGGGGYIAKFDSDGNLIWAKVVPATCSSIDTDPDGNIYISGYYSGTQNFGGSTLAGHGSFDVFAAKYSPNGHNLWAAGAGGTKLDVSWDISVWDFRGCVITGGYWSSSITFGSNVFSNSGSNTYNVFVARYDSAGTVLWAKKAGGPFDDQGWGVCFDTAGNVYATGEFYSTTLNFGGSHTLDNTDSSGTFSDVYVISFDHNGVERWMKQGSDLYNDIGTAIGCDNFGNTYVTGTFEGSSITFMPITLTSTGPTDFFITQIGNFVPVSGAPTTELQSGTEVFPNPASDKIFIRSIRENPIHTVKIFNVLGELAYTHDRLHESAGIIEISLTELPSGIYFINLSGPDISVTNKIIIRK